MLRLIRYIYLDPIWLQYVSHISTGIQYIYIAKIYLPKSNMSTWLQFIYLIQFIYLAPISLPSSNLSTWLQFIYLAPIYLPGSNLSTWLQFTYLAPIYLPGSNLSTWLQFTYLAPMLDLYSWQDWSVPPEQLVYFLQRTYTVRTRKQRNGKTT